MENAIIHYNPTIVNYINGTIEDNNINSLPIFIINLKDNIERRNYVNYVMCKMKINYKLVIVDKINDTIYDIIGKNNIKTDINKLGCIISHLFCLKLCIDSNYDKFIIFEDDIIFHKRFNELCNNDLINMDFDMLMLGACDFNLNHNNCFKYTQLNDLYIYKPVRQALGAHANIYSISFAKILYDFKIKNTIFEFDADFRRFYQKYKIYICMPNLVICELSTTNLKHNFGYNSREHTMYIKKVFPEDFTYNDYNYITIHFIEYVKEHYHSDNNVTLNQIVNEYIKLFNMDKIMKNTLCDNLLSGGYSIEDIQNIGK